MTARLDAASKVQQGAETELWLNTEHIHLFDPSRARRYSGQTATGPRRRSRLLGTRTDNRAPGGRR